MKRGSLFIFFALVFNIAFAQHYEYIDSSKVMGPKSYAARVKQQPELRLVEIKKYIPAIVLDIRYATTNNFMHRKMYEQGRAFARLPVVLALKEMEEDLKNRGLGLKIYDAYRPYSVTVKFYKETPDTNFVADPRKGSKHNRGCAIDLSLIDLKTGKELEMPTGFDSFSRKAAANYPDLPAQQLANRELLKSIMQAHGFKVIATEWWHYDFNGWAKFPLLDIPFETI
ncbi:M15 family metallopeptidase [Mucilaginibacter xinganensis]|uniref:D-alanyl-D-alanine dipeptidase n=1 Tax=Mucilaginibacter xinganensis TaxID=1234841 RepID=A0A223P303_9SPHI|nr:M15 family metallopeptidase [Mucilaginibacter xinganensis]ASU36503.1 D-alanyl-D-alanine dipeptidase [Mucilaginibacter xinganensis]